MCVYVYAIDIVLYVLGNPWVFHRNCIHFDWVEIQLDQFYVLFQIFVPTMWKWNGMQ